MEGWACILDRDKFVGSQQQNTNTVFYCPDTFDIQGMLNGQTGNDPAKPRGWSEWPMIFTGAGGDEQPEQSVTIPDQGFTKIIRVSYWINAYNPITTPGSTLKDFPSNGSLLHQLGWRRSGYQAEDISCRTKPRTFAILRN